MRDLFDALMMTVPIVRVNAPASGRNEGAIEQ